MKKTKDVFISSIYDSYGLCRSRTSMRTRFQELNDMDHVYLSTYGVYFSLQHPRCNLSVTDLPVKEV